MKGLNLKSKYKKGRAKMDDFFGRISIPEITLPESVVVDTPAAHIWVDEQYEILKKYIQEFENSLDDGYEVGLLLTNFGQSVLMQVTQVTYEQPVLMVFKGMVNGNETTLIQHINQLNFLLTKVKKPLDSPKRPIGFLLNAEDENKK